MSEEKFNPTKYKNDFQKEKYDRLVISVFKGEKAIIQEFAKSLNAYVVELIKEDMEKQKAVSAQ